MRIGTVCHSISWYSIIWTSNLIINLTIWLSLCGCSLQSFIQLNKLLWVVFGIYMPFRVHVLNCVSKLMSISALISATVWNFLGSSHQDQKYFDRLCGLLNRYLVNHNNQQHKQSMKKNFYCVFWICVLTVYNPWFNIFHGSDEAFKACHGIFMILKWRVTLKVFQVMFPIILWAAFTPATLTSWHWKQKTC